MVTSVCRPGPCNGLEFPPAPSFAFRAGLMFRHVEIILPGRNIFSPYLIIYVPEYALTRFFDNPLTRFFDNPPFPIPKPEKPPEKTYDPF